ncbi:MAG: restriction endonuclease subunit S [Solirubrobacteraceae bacterium]
MASTLYRSWFVDFDPVIAKAERTTAHGVPVAAHDLFPSRLMSSANGPIPEGWKLGSVYELTDVIYGASFASDLFNEEGEGTPLIRIRDLTSHAPKVFTAEEHPKATLIQHGDIICGMDGEFSVQRWRGPTSVLNQRMCLFRPKEGIPASFLAAALVRPMKFFERSKTGTTVIHLLKRDIDAIRLVIPPPELLVEFDKTVEAMVKAALDAGSKAGPTGDPMSVLERSLGVGAED